MKVTKLYGKVATAETAYQAHSIVERLEPELAKQVFLAYIRNQRKVN